MNSLQVSGRWRSQRRFGVNLDHRYTVYYWPINIDARCMRCGSHFIFHSNPAVNYEKDEKVGGYRVNYQPTACKIGGQGACPKCGKQVDHIMWPERAYFKFETSGGVVWAWDKQFLDVLRARVAGDRVLERQLCLDNFHYHYFLTRLPKHVVVKRHRRGILSKIDNLLRQLSQTVALFRHEPDRFVIQQLEN